jgi:molybdopterin converting factor small subunit
MEVTVRFFGVLAGIAGIYIKTYNDISSFGDLKLRIRDDFPGIEHYDFRFCVNGIFTDGEPTINDGDEIALLPRRISDFRLAAPSSR